MAAPRGEEVVMRAARSTTRWHQLLAVAVTASLAAGCSQPTTSSEPTPRGGPAPVPTTSSTTTPPAETSTSDPGLSTSTSRPARPLDPAAVAIESTIATGLQTPWDVDFLPDGAALVTLRDDGTILRIDGDRTTQLDAGGPAGSVTGVEHHVEDGLLGLAVGPDDGVYVYLTTGSDNRVVRYDLAGDSLVDPQVVLDGIPTHENHVGGRIAFGPDGFLYVTTGDVRDRALPQDTASLAGKILRVTTEGEPAPGNPFDNEVWSYGHRNVQGIGWTSDGRMYASEFGSGAFDEINLIEPGGNYGWPEVEGWAGDPDYIDPLVTWTTDEASPSGIAVTDEGIWVSALRGERLWFVPLQARGQVGQPVDIDLGLGRLRAVTLAPDGALWVVTSNTDGRGKPGPEDDRIVTIGS